jgi:hypothetical protein
MPGKTPCETPNMYSIGGYIVPTVQLNSFAPAAAVPIRTGSGRLDEVIYTVEGY